MKVTKVTVKNKAWPRSSIDTYILAKLEAAGIAPASDADKATLLRRATFDLTGLPPTPAEVEAFLADDSADAFAKVIDRLLASKQFGVHWGRHWLDGVRYRSRVGNIHVFRDWVVDSVNADKPYDRFLIEQIAGDLLINEKAEPYDPTPMIGTATLALQTGGCDLVERQLEVIGEQMMGMTLACARCHDHKYDPFTQQDYYALFGILQSSEIVGDGLFDGPALVHSSSERQQFHKIEKQWQELRSELSGFQKKHPKLVQLVQYRREAARSDKAKERLNKLLAEQKKEGWDLNAPELPRIEKVVNEEEQVRGELSRYQRILSLKDKGPGKDFPLLYNGERSQPGDIVPRRLPTIFAGDKPKLISEQTEGSGRLELARWVASRDNPLTARVMANRVWMHLMGQGIVSTPNNFGTVGEKPTHPLLLDYLAHHFVENDWSVKKLIRNIMLSRTYQLAARVPDEARAKDLTNDLFGRSHLRRLQYEQVHDTLFFVAGDLTLDPSPTLLSANKINDKSIRLRAIYDSRSNMGDLFDGPEDDLIIPQRSESTTAPQMLYLLNSRDVMDLAGKIVGRITKDKSLADDASRVNELYLTLFGRPAGEDEIRRAVEYLKSNPLDRFCHVLMCSNEFVYVE